MGTSAGSSVQTLHRHASASSRLALNQNEQTSCGNYSNVETNLDDAKYARLHNDANIIILAAKNTDINIALQMINCFLTTEFAGGKHATRVSKLT